MVNRLPPQGLRVLITHTLVQEIMGSTVVALELGRFLKSKGAEVTLFAGFIDEPMSHHFQEAGIAITSDDESLSVRDFDVIWIHSQVLPLGIVRELGVPLPVPAPRFVFNHMAGLDSSSDEFPYIAGLEDHLASRSLFVSREAMAKAGAMLSDQDRFGLFRNPAPAEFASSARSRAGSIRRALIVSNHPPVELRTVAEQLKLQGVDVVIFGRGRDTYDLVTPEVISSFDVVITIGKTVQYCLVSGTPVYIYDHFGGPGYLDTRNYEEAAYVNFSGRFGPHKSPEVIVEELVSGYPDALDFAESHRLEFAHEFSLDNVILPLLEQLEPRQVSPLDERSLAILLSAERFALRFYQRWGEKVALGRKLVEANRNSTAQQKQLEVARESLSTSDAMNASLRKELDVARRLSEQKEEELRESRAELAAVRSSKTFLVGNVIMTPLRAIARFLRLI